jgi:hypothetical protein
MNTINFSLSSLGFLIWYIRDWKSCKNRYNIEVNDELLIFKIDSVFIVLAVNVVLLTGTKNRGFFDFFLVKFPNFLWYIKIQKILLIIWCRNNNS